MGGGEKEQCLPGQASWEWPEKDTPGKKQLHPRSGGAPGTSGNRWDVAGHRAAPGNLAKAQIMG